MFDELLVHGPGDNEEDSPDEADMSDEKSEDESDDNEEVEADLGG